MHWLNQLSNTLEQHSGAALAGMSVAAGVLLLVALYLLASVVMLRRRYSFLLRHEDTLDIGSVFADVQKQVERLQASVDQNRQRLESLAGDVAKCVQKVGVVRFDAFDDVGGHQSFAVALLDTDDNGVILSSLYSRSDSRTYAKSVRGGKSSHSLSAEEQQALAQARSGSNVLEEPVL